MAKCCVCSKDVSFGLKVSHSNKKTNRMWKANIRKVKILEDKTIKSVSICTRCLRSNKVKRAI